MDSLTLFHHRRNVNGSYDSICPVCFATVCHSKVKAELAELELAHVCDSSYLAERGHFSRVEAMIHPAPLSPAKTNVALPYTASVPIPAIA
jgi:hypothetical protein